MPRLSAVGISGLQAGVDVNRHRPDRREPSMEPVPVAGIGHNSKPQERPSMYAISLDMDITALQAAYHATTWQNAYSDIRRVLSKHGFTRQQGGVYFGDDSVDAVRCVLAVQELTKAYSWFGPCVRDIRMLRIEDNNDLRPAIDAVLATS